MKKLRILLTGGGTGGHIYPLIAVANELKRQSESLGLALDLRYFGDARKYAQEIVDNGMDFVPILSSKLRRYWSILNLIDGLKFFLSLFQLLWKIFWFMPDAVFSKGGPGALAVILVSRFYGIPVIIQESDSIPGFTNKISGSLASKIFLAFASAAKYFKNPNVEVVGNPVREALFRQRESLKVAGAAEGEPRQGREDEQKQAQKGLGFNPNEPLVLVLGGSQGAERLNNFVLENLETLIKNSQLLHQVGERNYESYKKELEFVTKDWSEVEKNRYHFRAFFGKDLADALAAADLIIARAGAGTIFEMAAFGKPAILVPLSESANDHQKENARIYAESGAALVIQEENLLGGLMETTLNRILGDLPIKQKMGEAARSFYRPEAAAIIAKHLLTYV